MTKHTNNHRSICNAQEWEISNYFVELGDPEIHCELTSHYPGESIAKLTALECECSLASG